MLSLRLSRKTHMCVQLDSLSRGENEKSILFTGRDPTVPRGERGCRSRTVMMPLLKKSTHNISPKWLAGKFNSFHISRKTPQFNLCLFTSSSPKKNFEVILTKHPAARSSWWKTDSDTIISLWENVKKINSVWKTDVFDVFGNYRFLLSTGNMKCLTSLRVRNEKVMCWCKRDSCLRAQQSADDSTPTICQPFSILPCDQTTHSGIWLFSYSAWTRIRTYYEINDCFSAQRHN